MTSQRRKSDKTNNKSFRLRISYFQINFNLYPAIIALGDFEIDDVNLMLRIIRSRRNIEAAVDAFNQAKKTLAEGPTIKGDSGRPKIRTAEVMIGGKLTKQLAYEYPSLDVEADVKHKLDELDAEVVEIELFQATFKELCQIEGIKPNLISSLKEFVIYEDDVKPND